jgi:ADP-heptose:LPS heptosyltransferase
LRGLAHVAAQAALFVAGDTGPVHLADALGTPAVALFGPGSLRRNTPERNRPYRGAAVRYDSETPVSEVVGRLRDAMRDRLRLGGTK